MKFRKKKIDHELEKHISSQRKAAIEVERSFEYKDKKLKEVVVSQEDKMKKVIDETFQASFENREKIRDLLEEQCDLMIKAETLVIELLEFLEEKTVVKKSRKKK